MNANGKIPLIGAKPAGTTATESPFFGAALKHLQASLQKTGSTAQIVIGLFPDGSYTLNVQGNYPIPGALAAATALNQFLTGQASDMIVKQDMLIRAQQGAQASPLGRG